MSSKKLEQWFKSKIEEIAAEIGAKSIALARQAPESDGLPQQCFANVDRKIARDGGFKLLGWTPHWRRVETIPGPGYLFLTHHAVWMSDDGWIIDVTPYTNSKHAPLDLKDGFTPFIVDPSAIPVGAVSLPLRFISLDDGNPELMAYVTKLNADEAAHYEVAQANAL